MLERLINCDRLFDTDGKQNGIINELIRLMTREKKIITSPKNKDKASISWGLDIVDNKDFILGSFGIWVFNRVYKSFSGVDDRNDKENLVGNALLLISESLTELVTLDKYKEIFINLGLDQDVESMKAIILNEDYSKQLYGYLKKIVEIKIKGLIREGYSYNINGKEFHSNGKYEFTDYTRESEIDGANDEGDDNYYDGYINSIADTEAHKFTEYEEKNYNSVYSLILDNKENISTAKQLAFLKEWNNKDKYTNKDKCKYKKNIEKRLIKFCDECDKLEFINGNYIIKKTSLDDIVAEANKLDTNLDKFNYFMNKIKDDQTMTDKVIDIVIDKFDNSYYKPIINYINCGKVDLVFINTKFSKILNNLR